MAKQTVDKSTKEMHLVTTWDKKEDALKKVAEVIKKLQGLEIEYNEKKEALATVEAAGYNYAGTTYKAGKYLYLVYPSVDGQDRRREYVGADPAKISEAMAMTRSAFARCSSGLGTPISAKTLPLLLVLSVFLISALPCVGHCVRAAFLQTYA